MNRILLPLFLLALTLPVWGQTPANAKLMASASQELTGTQRVKKHVGGYPVVVVARIREGATCDNPEGWIWGVDQECPHRVLAQLRVAWGKHTVMVPASAYMDLTAVRSILVVAAAHGFAIELVGGDAATSYRAQLEFEGHPVKDGVLLRRRVVRSLEFSEEVWEETRYRFHPGTEPAIRR